MICMFHFNPKELGLPKNAPIPKHFDAFWDDVADGYDPHLSYAAFCVRIGDAKNFRRSVLASKLFKVVSDKFASQNSGGLYENIDDYLEANPSDTILNRFIVMVFIMERYHHITNMYEVLFDVMNRYRHSIQNGLDIRTKIFKQQAKLLETTKDKIEKIEKQILRKVWDEVGYESQ